MGCGSGKNLQENEKPVIIRTLIKFIWDPMIEKTGMIWMTHLGPTSQKQPTKDGMKQLKDYYATSRQVRSRKNFGNELKKQLNPEKEVDKL